MSKTANAFAIIHFGSNKKYFELELYFCIMLQKNTSNNIIYMYSETDTPVEFVNAIKPFVYSTKGFNDNGITYNVDFASKYTSFNTLRTCDFIFAYLLEEYDKVCIIESDLVIMSNIDSVFSLNVPAALCYGCGNRNINSNVLVHKTKTEILNNCVTTSDLNGGVMLIKPDKRKYDEYISSIKTIADAGCKYPNEALFEYVNNNFYNLPIMYNLSHYKTLNLTSYGLRPNGEDIKVYHFNETDFKHLDIIKDGWLKQNLNDPKVASKYRVRKLPIIYFENTIYEPYKDRVNEILDNLTADAIITEGMSKLSVAPVAQKTDWVEHMSKTHNRPYWYNTKTNQSVWVKPSELLGGKRKRTNKPKYIKKNNKKKTKKRKYTNKKIK